MYEVKIVSTRDRAEAPDLRGALLAARTLVSEAAQGAGGSRLLRRDLLVTRDGRYDGVATTLAQEGR